MRDYNAASPILRRWTCRALIALLLAATPGTPSLMAAGFQKAAEIKTVSLPTALAPLSTLPAAASLPSLSAPRLAAPAGIGAAPAALPQAALPSAAAPQAAGPLAAAPRAALPASAVAPNAAAAPAAASKNAPSATQSLHAAADDAAAGRDTGSMRFDGAQKGGDSGSGNSSGDGSGKSNAPAGLPSEAPVIALNGVWFPGTSVRLTLNGEEGMAAAKTALANGGYMIAASRPEKGGDAKGNYRTAVLIKLTGVTMDSEQMTARMEVVRTVRITGYAQGAGHDLAKVSYPEPGRADATRMGNLQFLAAELLTEFARYDAEVPAGLVKAAPNEKNPMALTTMLANGLPFTDDTKRRLLDLPAGEQRLEGVILEMMARIKSQTNLAAAAGEGVSVQDSLATEEAFTARIKAIGMPAGVQATALNEYKSYAALNPKDGEAAKLRSYLQWLLETPWSKRTQDRFDGAAARKILDQEHFGLDKVKERVLEFLAVRKKTGSKKGAILLFVGPPGVGKTSIASSIAAALGRRFVRLSLGGVHDESVLRGHGRTYQGSLPGQIIRQMKAAGTVNPVMLLDEVDKIGRAGNHGDPTAALLEILDPQQNSTFRDQYMDVPYDLSEVIFVVTANDRSAIPGPLQDRLEIIEFDGYTPLEKMGIAERHIIPEKLKATGLTEAEAKLTPAAIRKIIEGYTLESGVRNLRETIESVFRKVSAWIETRGEQAPGTIDEKDIAHYLGKETFSRRETTQNDVGVATGLAVNDYGGSTMNVVVRALPGTGRVRGRSQQLEMIKDSAENALTFVRTNAAKFGLENVDFNKIDLDIAFTPAGKIDGPSAGGLMTTAIISELSGRKVAPGLAMTGEITPDGRILPIGGLKQKVMAAHRMGYKTVIYPLANEKDVESIPAEVRKDMKLVAVKSYDEILPLGLAEKVPGRGAAYLKLAPSEAPAASASAPAAVPAPAASWMVRGAYTVSIDPSSDERDPVIVISGPQGVVDRYPLHEAKEVLRQATKKWWDPRTWASQSVRPLKMDRDEQEQAVAKYADLLASRARRR